MLQERFNHPSIPDSIIPSGGCRQIHTYDKRRSMISVCVGVGEEGGDASQPGEAG